MRIADWGFGRVDTGFAAGQQLDGARTVMSEIDESTSSALHSRFPQASVPCCSESVWFEKTATTVQQRSRGDDV
ncbi:hypothetical protein [Nonomuraea ceibae]|uniref:hypothetical protein n=1 Tax=Nonomuraea ceibae TaxID=1935170 RepID=UPI001C5F9C56|nr:hypothetical protein [Nonomuraea ceibae]